MANASFVAWLTSPAPPVWAAVITAAVLVFRAYPSLRQRWTEARTAEDSIVGNQWSRLTTEIGRLAKRIETLEAAEQRCREELADAKNRIAELEGYNMGHGSAMQEAQMIVSAEREADRKDKDRKK